MRRFLFSLLIWGIAFSIVTAQTNLVQNGTFDTDTTGWSNSTSGSIAWVDTEYHTSPGAAQITNKRNSSTVFSAGGVQCVTLPSPQADYYTIQGWIKVPTQMNMTAQGYIRLQFYINADCTSDVGDARDSNLVSQGTGWTLVSKTTFRPAGAQSVKVRLYVRKAGLTSAYAYVDDVELYASSPTSVTVFGTSVAPASLSFPSWTLYILVGIVAFGWVFKKREQRG